MVPAKRIKERMDLKKLSPMGWTVLPLILKNIMESAKTNADPRERISPREGIFCKDSILRRPILTEKMERFY